MGITQDVQGRELTEEGALVWYKNNYKRDVAVALIETWIRFHGASEEGKPGSRWHGREGVGTEGNGPWFESWLCFYLTLRVLSLSPTL